MTDIAMALAAAFSVMYFFIERKGEFIILWVWAITDRPPKQVMPVIPISFVGAFIELEDSSRMPEVISRKPTRIPWNASGMKVIAWIKDAATENIRM